jgi:hypothetical protein
MHDALTEALNAPVGRLAEILIRRVNPSADGAELPRPLHDRLDRLVFASGKYGELARVRFAAEISLLFEKAPNWTTQRIIPLFQWGHPEAASAWNARKYSSYIGSPNLFALTKDSFLELFARPTTPEEELRVYGEWLAVIMIANHHEKAGYPISGAEARSALRAAGERAMSSVAHRLAKAMEAAESTEKLERWRNVVGPVFEAIWPLDAEIQSSKCTFSLVYILRSTGEAFAEAADSIIPFIRGEDPRLHTSVHSISEAADSIYSSSPEKVLDMTSAVIHGAPPNSVYGLAKVLDRIRQHAPELADSRKFQKAMSSASAH